MIDHNPTLQIQIVSLSMLQNMKREREEEFPEEIFDLISVAEFHNSTIHHKL